ncbi:MAG: histidine kinase [Marinifilaceae bacterium]|jgi:sensor histidine kinase YesM|nr:histidine kinase [Marinifilaceae bacterium]
MNYKNKIILIVGFSTMLVFSISSLFIGQKLTHSVKKVSTDLAISKAGQSFLTVKNKLEDNLNRAETLSNTIEELLNQIKFNDKFLSEVLSANLIDNDELASRWCVISNSNEYNGGIAYKSDSIIRFNKPTGRLMSIWDNFQKKNTSIIIPQKDNFSVISFISPIIKDNELKGIAGIDIDLYKFQKKFYDDTNIGRAYVSVLSSSNQYISHPDESRIGTKTKSKIDIENIPKVLITGEEINQDYVSEFLKIKVFRIYKGLKLDKNNEWVVAISVPYYNINETVSEIRSLVIKIGVILTSILVIFLYFAQHKWQKEFIARQNAENKHKNAIIRLSSIMENSNQVMIFSVDKHYNYVSYNSMHKNDLERNENHTITLKSNYLACYDGDFRIRLKKYLSRAFKGENLLFEYYRNGKYYQQVFNSIVNQQGTIEEVSSFRFDISETVELREKAKIEKEEKTKAQLKNLKNQINPHFLFNSLNSLYALIEGDKILAKKFIVKLSKMYRYLLDSREGATVELRNELEFVKNYEFLQKIRFQDNLIIDYNISNNIIGKKIPIASLQSLIENAIKHNIITQDKVLEIKVYSESGKIFIENNYQPRTDMIASSGTGLKNIQDIYKALSIEGFEIYNDKNIYRVCLPIIQK